MKRLIANGIIYAFKGLLAAFALLFAAVVIHKLTGWEAFAPCAATALSILLVGKLTISFVIDNADVDLL